MYAGLAMMGLKYCHDVATNPMMRAAFTTGFTAISSAVTIAQAHSTAQSARTMIREWDGATEGVRKAARQYLNEACKSEAA